MELFVFSQFLSSSLLFLPGMQAIRFAIRALPYLASLALLVVYRTPTSYGLRPSGRLLTVALALPVIGLAVPEAPLRAGLAQCLFQLCIAAPLFWADGMVLDSARLRRLLWLILLANSLSAGVGLLQVFYPEHFMPSEFTSVGLNMNPNLVENLTYIGADGRRITRPPGLTDTPGGAAWNAMLAGILGLTLLSSPKEDRRRQLFCLACASVSIIVLYLTQVRSLFLTLLLAVFGFALIRNRRDQIFSGRWVAIIAVIVVAATFQLASSIGGAQVSDRYLGIARQGLMHSYQQNRGLFVDYTLQELVYQYPLGAGTGRWGMMNVYFGSPIDVDHPPLYAEIQATGWLYDGGIPMWIAYGGAIALALLYSYRVAHLHPDLVIANLAKVVFALQLCITASTFSGPSFNNQLGIQFWLLTGALFGVTHFRVVPTLLRSPQSILMSHPASGRS